MKYKPDILVIGDKEKIPQDKAHIKDVAFFPAESDLANPILSINNIKYDFVHLKEYFANNSVEYIVFTDNETILKYGLTLANTVSNILVREQIMSIDTFLYHVQNNFHIFNNDKTLLNILNDFNIVTLLDVDNYVASTSFSPSRPFFFNFLIDSFKKDHFSLESFVYNSFVNNDVLKRYNAVLITKNYNEKELEKCLSKLRVNANIFIIFVRDNSALSKYAKSDKWPVEFKQVQRYRTFGGDWYILRRKMELNATMFVVTHKVCDAKLPIGYQIIHAGHINSQDLGYLNDDTGDNISELNPFLNEMTAMYWIWKNNSDDIVGINHYRRFFSETLIGDAKKDILTIDRIRKILDIYDIIVPKLNIYFFSSFTFLVNDTGMEIADKGFSVVRDVIKEKSPQYLNTYDKILSARYLYKCNMMIAHKYLYDKYCEWLFPIILKSYDRLPILKELTGSQRRLLGYISERLFNVWLLNQDLRVKEIPIIENLD